MANNRKLGRPTDHRKAMLRALVTYLLENGKVLLSHTFLVCHDRILH